MNILEFEKPIIEISKKIEELEILNKAEPDVNLDDEITKLYEKLNKLKQTTYSKLNSWQKTAIARHQMRFGLLDFVEHATTDFLELQQDFLGFFSPIIGVSQAINTATIFLLIKIFSFRNLNHTL